MEVKLDFGKLHLAAAAAADIMAAAAAVTMGAVQVPTEAEAVVPVLHSFLLVVHV
jgi:hypothetical protein